MEALKPSSCAQKSSLIMVEPCQMIIHTFLALVYLIYRCIRWQYRIAQT